MKKDIVLNFCNSGIEIENADLKEISYPSVVFEQKENLSKYNFAIEIISCIKESKNVNKYECIKKDINENNISNLVAWTNIIFYLFWGNSKFTYGIYWPKYENKFSLYYLVEKNFDTTKTIEEYLKSYTIHFLDKSEVEKEAPEMAVFFGGCEIETINFTEKCPNIFLVFNISRNKCELSIYFKKCYSVKLIKNLLENIKILSLQKQSKVPIKNLKLVDLSVNKLKSHTISETDSLIGLIEKKCEMYPNRIIYEDERERISYHDMLSRIENISSRLNFSRKKIGILGDNCVKKIITVIGIIKSGNIYVPIDYSAPKNRINELIKEIGIDFILCESKYKKNVYLCPVYSYLEMEFSEKKSLPEKKYSVLDPICILSTSGTTGKPKKFIHSQVSIINAINEYRKICDFTKNDVIGLRSPLQHVPSTIEIFIGLVLGIKTVIVPERVIINPDKLYSFISKYKISWIQMVPTIIDTCLSYKGIPANVKYLVSLGENLPYDLAKDVFRKSNSIKLITNYGMTEFNMITLGILTNKSRASSIGKAISNTLVAIVNSDNKVVPKGIIGQIAVCNYNNGVSINVSNTENMIYVNDLDEYMYLTGDYGYYLENEEEIIYIGRKDSVCKIHGKRVELSYVENIIRTCNFVKECKTIKGKHHGKEKIIAYVVLYNAATIIDVKKFLREKIESYMIPEVFIEIQEMPKTNTGKIKESVLEEMYEKSQNKPSLGIKAIVEEIVGHSVDDQMSFKDLGISSLQMIELASKIEKKFIVNIDVTSLYNYSTVQELEKYITERQEKSLNEISIKNKGSTKIAVIGISGLFPKNLEFDEFYEAIKGGRDFVSNFPQNRKEKIGYSNQDTIISGGYFDDIEYFDSLFFGISPREAMYMSYEQKFALMYVWKLIENSGYTKESLDNKNISVFIGVGDKYSHLDSADENGKDLEYKKLGSDTAMVAARISYFFNWHGSCMAVNTACSSSLLAIDLAYKSIINDGADYAIAGGMNIITSKQFFEHTKSLGMFATNGDCFPFDDRASGIVPGEAIGFVLLKPLQKAVDDHDYIYAIIDGTYSNQDGRSNGITAPNGMAQERLIKSNLLQTDIKPEEIKYVEAHGTGTKLGDPIEFKSLVNVFNVKERWSYCALGSIKANLGHTIAAAGIVSFIKACMCLKGNYLVPQIKFNVPNKFINMIESPFYVNTSLERLTPEDRNIICINSFGYSGTNVNVLVENYSRQDSYEAMDQKYYFFPITAKTLNAYWKQIENLYKYLRVNQFNIADISYTLQMGRSHLKNYRKVFIAKTVQELIKKLDFYFHAHKFNNNDLGADAISDEIKEKIKCFEDGEQIDWKDITIQEGRKVPLPTYPFDDRKQIDSLDTIVTLEEDKELLSQHFVKKESVIPAAKIISSILESKLTGINVNQIENLYFLKAVKTDLIGLIKFTIKNSKFTLGYNDSIYSTGNISMASDSLNVMYKELDEVQKIYSMEEIYTYYSMCGIEYGDSFRKCLNVKLGKINGRPYAFAEIYLGSTSPSDTLTVLLDVSFHSVNYALNEHDAICRIPYFVRKVRVLDEINNNLKYYVMGFKTQKGININIFSEEKKCIITIDELALVSVNQDIGLKYPVWKKTNVSSLQHNVMRAYFDYCICLEKLVEFKNNTYVQIGKTIYRENTDDYLNEINCSNNSIMNVLIILKLDYKSYFEAYKIMMSIIKKFYCCKKINLLVAYLFGRKSSNIINASLESFLKVIHNENPKISFKMIELPHQIKADFERIISIERGESYQNSLIKYNKDGQRLTFSSVIQKLNCQNNNRRLKKKGTYLIVGGMGGIGKIIGKYFAQKYNADIIFAGRKKLDKNSAQFLSEIADLNTKPQYLQVDITDKESIRNILTPLLDTIDGVINCAGVLNDSFFVNKQFSDSRAVLETKIIGSLNLYEFFKNSKIEFLVLFSSVSADIGQVGQCDYAYANKFISLFCEMVNPPFHLSAIDWGYWNEGGMKMNEYSYSKLASQNIHEISPNKGCELLENVINSDLSHVLIY